MSLKNYINEFSAGKIILKYNLIHPEVSESKRKIINMVYILFSFIVLYFILKIYDRFPFFNAGFAVLVWILFGLVTGKITHFFTSGYTIYGKLFFYENHLEIEKNEDSQKIIYEDINAIFYQTSLLKNTFHSNHSDPKSIKIKFMLKNRTSLIIEAENELIMTKEDFMQFRKAEPGLTGILEEIKPRYGVERVKNILKTD
ncbi:MAG: hypothetical protein ACOZCO_13675 [Bacteroidota bacterium]